MKTEHTPTSAPVDAIVGQRLSLKDIHGWFVNVCRSTPQWSRYDLKSTNGLQFDDEETQQVFLGFSIGVRCHERVSAAFGFHVDPSMIA